MTVLDEILAATRAECDALRSALPEDVRHTPIDVAGRLGRGPSDSLRLIAEIKLRSPSAGPLSRGLSVSARAEVYAREGAAMISVLVDRRHFDGGYHHLAEARAAVTVPLLAKGFTIDELQIEAARRAGADAILLIVRILDDARLRALHDAVRRASLTPIVEVIDEGELARALALDARVIGVNARDLSTLVMDGARASRVLGAVPPDRVALWFSGISTTDDVIRVATGDARTPDGALVGEALMRRDDPAELLRALVGTAANVATALPSSSGTR